MPFESLKSYFDSMPVAFTVIKLVLNKNGEPIDFIFCYGNDAFAKLEGIALTDMLNKRFYKDVFTDRSDTKWLDFYYSCAFLNQNHELHDYSPEIDKYLKIVCYPWLEKGYCACLLFDETEIVNMKKRLNRLANVDEFTNFNNRNAYQNFCNTNKNKTNTGAIFVDINNLKEVNDRFGHDTGDLLIKTVKDKIKICFNEKSDQIFRIGGDEFVIIIQNISYEACRKRVIKLKKSMTNHYIPFLPNVLASIGWHWQDRFVSIKALVDKADQEMYKDKKNLNKS